MTSPPTDPREMRKRISTAAYRGDRIDGNNMGRFSYSSAASLAHAVLVASEAQGYSGEDCMTVLAYNALVRYEDLMDRLLENYQRTPIPHFIAPSGGV